ncbi:GumC family protein [Porphyrobacter sp. LM 6]|uniref:GumC family protein n=1 Tax=Porphyrobacter sp. LM 6 TaxID=1896196 RepID=UPI0008469155|nr:polysaccharide biosynthesis tyrosine autokinase [Porphyrobacter sp. LM 6]AOL94445.1 capsular exopolysaccharide family [Porphyrobacter sp. LM 6]
MNSGATRFPNTTQGSASRRRAAAPAFSMAKIMAGAYRQRMVLLGVLGVALALGALVTFLTPRTYSATAAVQLNQQVPRVLPDRDLDPEPAVQESERFLQTQVDRILSHSMAETVEASVRASATPRILEALGLEEGADLGRDDVIDAIQENVSVELGVNTRLARISVSSRDPVVSAQLANAYADALSSTNLVDKSTTASQAEQFLATQLAEAKIKLQDSERAMLAYARRTDLTTAIVPGQDRGGSLRAQQAGVLADQLALATSRRIEAQQAWSQVQATPALALPEVQDNRAMQDLIRQRGELEAVKAAETDVYTEKYPGVTATAAKIEQIDAEINRLASNIKRGYEVRYNAAARAERQLAGAVDALRNSAMSERERSVDYNALEREVEANRAFYDGLLQRYQQVAAASGSPGENVLVVDRAEPPKNASSPNIPRNMALAAVLGLAAAMGVGLLRERSVSVVRTADEAEHALDLPNIGMVPAVPLKQRVDVEMLNPRSPQSEAYYSAAVALHQLAGNKLPKVVLVTSCTPREGKSTTSIGLARSYGAMRDRVLLIDGDLRRPSLAAMLGARIGPGMADLLAGTTTIEGAVQKLDDQRFDLIIAGQSEQDPVGLLSSDTVGATLAALGEHYDVIIIDGPPVLGIADAILLAGHAEVAVFVIEAGRIETEQARIAVSRLPSNVPTASILTKFQAREAGVKYGSRGYYQY